jgi:translation initiation factor IF-3
LKSTNNFWRLNEKIPATTLRVLDSEGKQVGVISKDEALKTAKEKGLDLIEIAPNANPPVVTMMDFGKFRYREEKKLKEVAKKSKPTDLKELRFTPFIGEGDYQTRLKRIDEFFKDRNKVKLVVYFKVKQLGSKQFGYDIFNRVLNDLGDGVNIDMKPKFLGRNLIIILSPTSQYGKVNGKVKNEQAKDETASN